MVPPLSQTLVKISECLPSKDDILPGHPLFLHPSEDAYGGGSHEC